MRGREKLRATITEAGSKFGQRERNVTLTRPPSGKTANRDGGKERFFNLALPIAPVGEAGTFSLFKVADIKIQMWMCALRTSV